MKISTKGRYAMRLMIDIARYGEDGNVSMKDVAKRENISIKYLEQIVSMLVKSGLLCAQRGAQGGYRLTRDVKDYSVWDILRVTEGDLAPVACLEEGAPVCDMVDNCSTVALWRGLGDVMKNYLTGVSIADLASVNSAE